MDISADDAYSVLLKWKQEGRNIQFFLQCDDGSSCSGFGRIAELGPAEVRIDARKMHRLGSKCGIRLQLAGTRFSLEDWRDSPPEHTERLQKAYDAFLFAALVGGGRCSLYALKFSVELSKLIYSN